MKGRKLLRLVDKQAKGTLRPCRVNKNAPTPPAELPTAPYCQVSDRCNVLFGMVISWLQSQSIASVAHTANITHLAMLLEKIERLYQSVQKYGDVIVVKETKVYMGNVVCDKEGNPVVTLKPRPNPYVAQLSDALRHAQAMCAELGLSPTAVGKVGAMAPQKPANANPWESLLNG